MHQAVVRAFEVGQAADGTIGARTSRGDGDAAELQNVLACELANSHAGLLADLPADVLSNILVRAPWATRQVCRAFRALFDSRRDSLVVQWHSLLPQQEDRLRNMLAGLPQLTALGCGARPKGPCHEEHLTVAWLSLFTKLRSLSLAGYGVVTGVENVCAACPHLTSVNLGGICYQGRVFSQHPCTVAAFTQLTSLALGLLCHPHCGVEDVSRLSTCTKLVTLTLNGCTYLSDFTPLSALTRLTSLALGTCAMLVTIDPLSACTALASVTLGGCEGLVNLDPLASLLRLTSLSVTGASLVKIIDPLSACSALASLTLGGCEGLENVDALATLTRLTLLSLRGGRLVEDICKLSELARLVTLDLQGCEWLSSIWPLRLCTALVRVNLRACIRLDSISPLTCCAALEAVAVNECSELHDLQRLTACRHLASFSADVRVLSLCADEGSALAQLTRLRSLRLDPAICFTSDKSIRRDAAAAISNIAKACSELTSLQVLVSHEYAGAHVAGIVTSCHTLTEVVLCRSLLADLSCVAACHSLRSLHLTDDPPLSAWQQPSSLSLEPLAHCLQLEQLSLCRQPRLDLSPLTACVRLRDLTLSNCSGLDIAPLASCKALRWLDLSESSITQAAAAATCPWLC